MKRSAKKTQKARKKGGDLALAMQTAGHKKKRRGRKFALVGSALIAGGAVVAAVANKKKQAASDDAYPVTPAGEGSANGNGSDGAGSES